jgi:4-diphosphocytidyl-2-C-methyl-D-erythritol kinase
VLTLNSYAKLNLYLTVRNRRKDNFHNITTIFERIDLYDTIILKPRRDEKIKIICSKAGLPKDNSNLAWRAAKLLQKNFNINQGVSIQIIKRIPIGAGLAGGSSNAASVLLGLNKIWKLNLSIKKLCLLGAKLGSDVPFFLYNRPFALGEGRGDKIEPLNRLNKSRFWHILVVPRILVSTPLVYRKWDDLKSFRLTIPKSSVKIIISALVKKDLLLLTKAVVNSLEPVTTALYPEISQIKEKLHHLGIATILMSGSGPAVFGVVSSRKEAVSLREQLRQANHSWQVFLARTI